MAQLQKYKEFRVREDDYVSFYQKSITTNKLDSVLESSNKLEEEMKQKYIGEQLHLSLAARLPYCTFSLDSHP